MNRRPGLSGRAPLLILLCLTALTVLTPPGGALGAGGELRVFVQPVSGTLSRGFWKTPDDEFARLTYEITERLLSQKGFYQVIPKQEVQRLLQGKEPPDWRWAQKDWALAREIGRGLAADYAMVVERGFHGFLYWRMILINLATGQSFDVQEVFHDQGQADEFRELGREAYRKIFQKASADLLATAIRKGKGLSDPTGGPTATGAAAPPGTAAKPSWSAAPRNQEPPPPAPPRPKAPAVAARPAPPALPEGRPAPGKADAGKTRLIVYDFAASAELEMAGLILSEAFREELHRLGRFVLINREDMVRALEEHQLKMAGLVEEEGSAEIGKWLMAGEMITGRLARLGNTNILQAKRTDIESLDIRNLGSLKCPAGREEELLSGMPQLARQLFGSR